MTNQDLLDDLWNELDKTRSDEEATTWPCRQCHGLGYYLDGWLEIGPNAVRSGSRRLCIICKGKGRVLVSPIP
jgi:hypothetical protein